MELLRPYAEGEMRAYEVSTLVNSPAHDTPEVTRPAA
jgi:putative SOS response-associated peptidase YedK